MKPLPPDGAAVPPDLDPATFLAFLPHVVLAEERCRLAEARELCAMPVDSRSEHDIVVKEWFSYANRHDTLLSASALKKHFIKHE